MYPKVSVIVPVYNVEAYLSRCLDSLIKQTLKEIEIICVDDESTDNSLAILNSYAQADNRIQVITQKNKRQGGARNTGFDKAKGEYILYIDSDDWVDFDYCEKLYDAAVRNLADVACISILKHYATHSKWVLRFSKEIVYHSLEDKYMSCKCPPDFHPINKLIKRESLLQLGLRFKEHVQYEDVEYIMQVLGELGDLVTVPGSCYHYMVRGNSTVKGRNTIEKQWNKYIAHKNFVRYADLKGLSLKQKYRSFTKRVYGWGGICLLKLKECDGVETWRLFDILPVWKRKL